MNPYGIWEQIYLQSIRISEINSDQQDSLKQLCEYLSTIGLLLPERLEPVTDFELYVVGHLCRHLERILSAQLSEK